jgi:hypothetical protein
MYLCDPRQAIPTHSNSALTDSSHSSVSELADRAVQLEDGTGMWTEENLRIWGLISYDWPMSILSVHVSAIDERRTKSNQI